MSVVAYASANIDPVSNPNEDYEVDLSVTPLGTVPAAQLYGAGVDSEDAGAVWTYSWTLLASMPGSAAALSDAAIQNPLVNDIDTWGNIRLMLTVTNTNTGATSESDPLKAPSSAFVVIRVLSEKRGIQKMQVGERNWHNDAWVWADKIEEGWADVPDHEIIDHTDVTNATGADLEALTQGGYAVDASAGNPEYPVGSGQYPLHKHYGHTVNAATSSQRGTVLLDLPWGGGGDPVVLTQENNLYNGQSLFSNHDTGHVALVRPHGKAYNSTLFTEMIPAHLVWYVPSDCVIRRWSCTLMYVLRWDGPSAYEIRLIQWTTKANMDNHVYSVVNNSTITFGAPDVAGGPITILQDVGEAITGPCWIGVQVHDEPDTSVEYAYGLQATMHTEVTPGA